MAEGIIVRAFGHPSLECAGTLVTRGPPGQELLRAFRGHIHGPLQWF